MTKLFFEVIEKYFVDIENKPIWEFLNIKQSNWSKQKRQLSPKVFVQICEYFEVSNGTIEEDIVEKIIHKYYQKI